MIMVGLVRYYAANHPEEFADIKARIEKKLDQQEDKNPIVLVIRNECAVLLDCLKRAGAPLTDHLQLYEMLRSNARFSKLTDAEIKTISEQEFTRSNK